MEKRLIVFFALSFAVLMIFSSLQRRYAPKRPKKAPAKKELASKGKGSTSPAADKKATGEGKRSKSDGGKDSGGETKAGGEKPVEPSDGGEDEPSEVRPKHPERIIVLGDYRGKRAPFVAYFNAWGGTLEHVELVARKPNGKLRYRELERGVGYLGYLSLVSAPAHGGCRVRVVADGTPAARAKPVQGKAGPGLRVGDIVTKIAGRSIKRPGDVEQVLKMRRPGTSVKVEVRRPAEGAAAGEAAFEPIVFQVELDAPPLRLVRLERDSLGAVHPSLRTTILELNELTLRGGGELSGLDMYDVNWEVVESTSQGILFRYQVPQRVLKAAKVSGELAVLKSFRLAPAPQKEGVDAKFHMDWSLRYEYSGKEQIHVALRQYGLNGLPLEGWWYATKISPKWGGAGARDVVWRNRGIGHSLLSAGSIYKEFKGGKRRQSILTGGGERDERLFSYVGVDTQFFSAVVLPAAGGEDATIEVVDVQAEAVGALKELKSRAANTQNVTFLMDLAPVKCEATTAGDRSLYRLRLYLGPKVPSTLEAYGIRDVIEYGWFGFVAKPLSKVLHFFVFIVRNYGIAIIMLTVLVRGAMWPLGRKAARNAQVMQLLSPQIKEIKEKYKNDMEKQSKALQELWRRHNFHPLSGCWVMFLQLPIFIGLYRSLSVDIELRQAPLIPGIEWCSNLAGPDQFLYWKSESLAFLTSETGWLGPYLNLLPVVTIILFIVQQKLFTPPATDEQSAMQQKMMKYMMIFFGIMFFKVPAGLCIYFISSSIWGIMERKLLPKVEVSLDGSAPADDAAPAPEPRASSKPSGSKPGMAERLKQMMDKNPEKDRSLDADERKRRKREYRRTRRPKQDPPN